MLKNIKEKKKEIKILEPSQKLILQKWKILLTKIWNITKVNFFH